MIYMMYYGPLPIIRPCTSKIPAGFFTRGDSADFIQVNNLKNLTMQETYIQGTCVYDGEKCIASFPQTYTPAIISTRTDPIRKASGKAKGKQMRVIVCEDRELITKR